MQLTTIKHIHIGERDMLAILQQALKERGITDEIAFVAQPVSAPPLVEQSCKRLLHFIVVLKEEEKTVQPDAMSSSATVMQ